MRERPAKVNAMTLGIKKVKKARANEADQVEDLQDLLEDTMEDANRIQQVLGHAQHYIWNGLGAELKALDRELLIDGESSYLYKAASAPAVPDSISTPKYQLKLFC